MMSEDDWSLSGVIDKYAAGFGDPAAQRQVMSQSAGTLRHWGEAGTLRHGESRRAESYSGGRGEEAGT